MTAAIAAARKGACVTILEHQEKIGRKLLSTGNGRCNFTNLKMGPEYFRGESPERIASVLERFGSGDSLRFFRELGVLTKTRDSCVYPRTGQASTILEALSLEIRRLNITVRTGVHVESIQKRSGEFLIRTAKSTFDCKADRVILAAGGRAAEKLGSDGSGYLLAGQMGHSLAPVVPALVQLRSSETYFKRIAGVRADAAVTLYVDGRSAARDTGEIQITDYGISGIPVFQISRYASMGLYQEKEIHVAADFLPSLSEKEFSEYLLAQRRLEPRRTASEMLSGILHHKLIPVLLRRAHISTGQEIGRLSSSSLDELIHVCKHFIIPIKGTNSFAQAQVCAGGVLLSEVREDTLESLLVPGLYIVGELLDADGMCGGYNLQWAWTTGYLAGEDAAREQEDI